MLRQQKRGSRKEENLGGRACQWWGGGVWFLGENIKSGGKRTRRQEARYTSNGRRDSDQWAIPESGKQLVAKPNKVMSSFPLERNKGRKLFSKNLRRDRVGTRISAKRFMRSCHQRSSMNSCIARERSGEALFE